jgi:hypothetical protein
MRNAQADADSVILKRVEAIACHFFLFFVQFDWRGKLVGNAKKAEAGPSLR